MKTVACSKQETKKAALCLAQGIVRARRRKTSALVFGLIGELGSGKTFFIKALAKGLGVTRRVTSPSFLIIQRYEMQLRNFTALIHIDAYRLDVPEELLALNFKDVLNNPRNIVIVEWADKVRSLLPKDTRWISFKHGTKTNERIIKGLL